MDPFTQSMISRTKQRQAKLSSKPKTETVEKPTLVSRNPHEKMSVIDQGLKENMNVTFTKQESPKRDKDLTDIYSPKKRNSPASTVNASRSVLPQKSSTILGTSRSALTQEKKLSNTNLLKGDPIDTKTHATGNMQASVENPIPAVVLEKPILKTLETQGFTPSNSRSRLIYQFTKEQAERDEEDAAWVRKHRMSPKTDPSKNAQGQEKNLTSSLAAQSSTSSSAFRTSQFSTPKKAVNSPSKQYSPSSLLSKTPNVSKASGSPKRFSPSSVLSKTPSVSKISPKRFSPSAVLAKTPNISKISPKRFSPSSGLSKTPSVSKPTASPKRFSPSVVAAKTLDRPKPVAATPSRQFSASALGARTPERTQNSISSRIAQFESQGPPKKDPCEMTLSERKKFFESSAQQPTPSKACFTPKPKPAQPLLTDSLPKERPSQVNLLSKNSTSSITEKLSVQKDDATSSNLQKQDDEEEEKQPVKTVKKFFSPVKAPVESSPKPLPTQSNFYEQEKTIPSITVTSVNEDILKVRPIRVSPPKPGKLYPDLSDIEVSTTESEPEYGGNDSALTEDKDDVKNTSGGLELDSSFAVDILGKAGLMEYVNTPKRKFQTPQKTIQEERPLVSNLDFDKAEPETNSKFFASVKNDTNSASISTAKYSNKDDLEESVNENQPRLFHSISFYRKQQQELIATPKKEVAQNIETENKQIVHKKARAAPSISIQEMIRNLQEEVKAQEIVMAQASQALNFCRSTAEFSGSTEQVEGEKLLLIATQKRHAACSEISRLKAETNVAADSEQPISHGNLSISDVKLPLKKEFLALLSKGGDDFVHYFILMIRHQGQVIPLQMLSTLDGVSDGALRFPNLIQLRDLPPTFQLTIEVYALQTRKEKLDHEVKYHIKKETNKLRLTPRKSESRLHSRAPKTNPHQMSSLRSSSFGLVGFCQISQTTLKQNVFDLEKIPAASPISGQLHVKIQCHADVSVDERGFLTVFEDVGGYGAWHRRWCLLSNDQLLFWKYPDEERRKDPLAYINLRKCVTEKVDVVPHDVCARPHTFLLVTARPPKEGDKDSLVMTTSPQQTLIKNLLSADTKEERIRWCSLLNKVLSNLRTWDIDSSS